MNTRFVVDLSWQRYIVIGLVAFTATSLITSWVSFWATGRIEDHHRRVPNDLKKALDVMNCKKLAVIVPIHQGDQERAMESLQRWPKQCHPLTKHCLDLVIYKAERDAYNVGVLTRADDSPARCFRRIFLVSGNLDPKENIYPKGPSVQFYKLFLDAAVREHFVEYDALAIIEWDVVIAHDTSFERLYKSAFTSSEPFWVKGSTLIGSEFLETASSPEKWHILGHLNGNAIYNNTDSAFREYVNFTFSRWGFQYSYDVALWATISDFPYSWPLWQRYSPKFVATNLISNVGFHDVTGQNILSAVAVDTFFIHGSTKSHGSVSHNKAGRHWYHANSTGCTDACGTTGDVGGFRGISTTCDLSCLDRSPYLEHEHEHSRCGAGNPVKFGPACRACVDSSRYTPDDHRKRIGSDTTLHEPEPKAIECNAVTTPESTECSQQCKNDIHTVCDSRCGSGLYGNFHCNWRGLGKRCRFCFRDAIAARVSDNAAIAMGGRVVMCDTFEPPLDEASEFTTSKHQNNDATYPRDYLPLTKRSLANYSEVDISLQGPVTDMNPSVSEFFPDIARGQICAFIQGFPGYHEVIRVSVQSINLFMPGMRVAVATHPSSFRVYSSTLGQIPGVSVVNSSRVQYAALEADRACGIETRLIYYMSPGQILSRPFTSKDTHSPKGELVVIYKAIEELNEAQSKRTIASAALLGFHPPLFTLGTDLILPVKINKHLRTTLYAMGSPNRALGGRSEKEENEFYVIIQTFLEPISKNNQGYNSIYLPEVLAAEAFHQNWDGIQFSDLRQWNQQNLFRKISIWDIPLIKPRFGCILQMNLPLSDHNVANGLQTWLVAFTRGARCEKGFVRPL